MSQEVMLVRPGLFNKFPRGLFGRRIPKFLIKAGRDAGSASRYQPNIAVLIRTRNDESGLSKIIQHIEAERQNHKGRIDLIVADTESTDNTLRVARKAGAQVVNLKQKDFNYPKGMNLGLAMAKKDVEVAYITVGHAQPALSNCYSAGARHFADPQVVGVYADYVPSDNATFWERLANLSAIPIYLRIKAGSHKIDKVRLGAMQGTSCAVRLSNWKEHPFDEAFGRGGEDLEWARQAFARGGVMVYDPVITVHHSHHLGFINLFRQAKYWAYAASKPGDFKEHKLHRYRKDLRSQ